MTKFSPALGLALLASWGLTGSSVAKESDFAVARRRKVAEQLAGRDITNQHVLRVMRTVPRHELVPAPQRGQAYADHPLPIGHEQTISQPYIWRAAPPRRTCGRTCWPS